MPCMHVNLMPNLLGPKKSNGSSIFRPIPFFSLYGQVCAGFVSTKRLHLIKISALDCLICNDAVTRVMTAAETLRLITGENDSNMIVINFVMEHSQFRSPVHR